MNRLRPGLHVPFDVNAQKDDPIVSFSHNLRAFAALAPGFLSERDTAGLRAASRVRTCRMFGPIR